MCISLFFPILDYLRTSIEERLCLKKRISEDCSSLQQKNFIEIVDHESAENIIYYNIRHPRS